ncbi:MAG: hypothetical protein HYY13_10925 [Nitrospirae bacterium]|nr:hypothetical protein [Nitrospirota bacterium]
MTRNWILGLLAGTLAFGAWTSCGETDATLTDGGIGGTGMRVANDVESVEVLSSASAVTASASAVRSFYDLVEIQAVDPSAIGGVRGGVLTTASGAPRRTHFSLDTSYFTTTKAYLKCSHDASGNWVYAGHDQVSVSGQVTDFSATYQPYGSASDCEVNTDYDGVNATTFQSCTLSYAELEAYAKGKPTSACVPRFETASGIACVAGTSGCEVVQHLENNEYDDLLGLLHAEFKLVANGGATTEAGVDLDRTAKTWTSTQSSKGASGEVTSVVERAKFDYKGKGEPDATIAALQDSYDPTFDAAKAKLYDFQTKTCKAGTPAAVCAHFDQLVAYTDSEDPKKNPQKEDLLVNYSAETLQADGTAITASVVPGSPFACGYDEAKDECTNTPSDATLTKSTRYPAGSAISSLEEKMTYALDAASKKADVALGKTTTGADGSVSQETFDLVKDESTGRIVGAGSSKGADADKCFAFDGVEGSQTGKFDVVTAFPNGTLQEEHVAATEKGAFSYSKATYSSGTKDCAAFTVTGGKAVEKSDVSGRTNPDGTGTLTVTNADGSTVTLSSSKKCVATACTWVYTGSGRDSKGSFQITSTVLPSGITTVVVDWKSLDGSETAHLELTISPDGAGKGTLTHNAGVFNVTLNADQSVRLCLTSGTAPDFAVGQCVDLAAGSLG